MRTRASIRREHEMAVKHLGGFRVFPGCVRVDPVDVESMHAIGKSQWVNIFNPDRRRRQAALPIDAPIVQRLLGALEHAGLLVGRSVHDAVVIVSEAGCGIQEWHRDYDPEAYRGCTIKPLAVLLSCEEGGRWIHEHGEVALGAGDVVVFDGDVVHRGAPYRNRHMRVHVYLDSPECRRMPDATYLASIRPFLHAQ